MRKFLGLLVGLLVPAVVLVVPAGAAVQAPTGDTCAASGAGTTYTLVITLPANAAPQGGFAFGATGVKVTSVDIPGNTGTTSTENLPADTTGQWLMANTPRPGESVSAVLRTSRAVTGSFRVVATSSPPSGPSFKPFLCEVSRTNVAANAFTVNQHVTYDSTAGAWHLAVTVPGPGTVTGIQAVAMAAGSGSKAVAAKSLVQSRKVVAKSAGVYTLTLRPTSGGLAALASSGSIKLEMTVAFNPADGRSASRVLSLTLTR